MRHLGKAALGLSLAGLGALAAPAGAEILIGGAICLTGVQAPLDEPGFKGAQVAIKQINDAGGLLGQKVRFLNIDGKSDPVTVGNAAVELIDQGAQLIVAPCDFDFGGPASRDSAPEPPRAAEPRMRLRALALSVQRSRLGTVSTGMGERRTSFSATLPSKRCARPVRPCVPTTTRS